MSTPSDTYNAVHEVESSQLPKPARFVDLKELFCAGEQCPAFAGGVPVLADGSHPTKQYAAKIAPAFKVLAAKAGVS